MCPSVPHPSSPFRVRAWGPCLPPRTACPVFPATRPLPRRALGVTWRPPLPPLYLLVAQAPRYVAVARGVLTGDRALWRARHGGCCPGPVGCVYVAVCAQLVYLCVHAVRELKPPPAAR